MKSLIVLTLVTLLSISCSFIEPSEKQKAKAQENFEKKIGEIRDKYSGPIYLLISSTCSYKSNYNSWPVNLTHLGKASLFSDYQVKNEIPYVVHFKFKEDQFNWELTLNHREPHEKCAFELIGKKESGRKFFQISHSYDIEKFKTIDSDKYISESNALARQMYFPIIFAEISKQIQQIELTGNEKTKLQKVTSGLGNLFVVFVICALLDVDPSQCSSGSSISTQINTDSGKFETEKERHKKKLEEKLKNLFHED